VPGSRSPSSKSTPIPARLPRRHDSPIDLAIDARARLLEAFLQRPHQEIRELHGMIGDSDITLADFRTCRRMPVIAMMPQWISLIS